MTAKRDRVRRHLLEVIEDAGPGTGLPSERDLAAALGVSRPTVRAAVAELVRSGLLVREHGRGTFTSPQKITQRLAGALGVPPAQGEWTSHVVEFGPARTPAARAALLGPVVLRVVRVRLVDAEPIAIEHLELPAPLVPGLAPADMETGNFYRLLRTRYGITAAEAVQTLEPGVTDPAQADLLDVPPFFPVMRVQRTTEDVEGRTVEHARSVYRGDRYRITSTLHFDHTSG
ncbi:GntR family transcriptional regulator [Actinomadura parmotrematis]|uniref:GntR family transcriptional regulator n=1 Tax=Actinomadura parmotrematis TaxID=2864039 RepID=A0ABS7FM57_9ACTN|nr:GntR family transcriptional regulator [Actinomadura parmotrematis]MBW8481315.1 GntR family transcriptional regulator [Actinomadura parmotrematis]